MESLFNRVTDGLKAGKSMDDLRYELLNQGFLADDVDEVLAKFTLSNLEARRREEKKRERKFLFKELFDRIGYGFGAAQFVNILFWLSGASLFFVGMFNGLRVIFGIVATHLLDRYKNRTSNKFIGRCGILLGFSFLLMAMFTVIHQPWLFGLALLVGAVAAVCYGNLYQELFSHSVKREKRGAILSRISYVGLLITGLSLLLAAYIMDRFPETGVPVTINFLGMSATLRAFGYLIAFEICAIAFILAGYVLTFIKGSYPVEEEPLKGKGLLNMPQLANGFHVLMSHKFIFLTAMSSSLITVVQTLANSYYGLFIFSEFGRSFVNVAWIFLIALVTSFVSPVITRINARQYGTLPLLVFGALLMSIMPLTYYVNPTFLAISIATMVGVMGSVIVGVASSIFLNRIPKGPASSQQAT